MMFSDYPLVLVIIIESKSRGNKNNKIRAHFTKRDNFRPSGVPTKEQQTMIDLGYLIVEKKDGTKLLVRELVGDNGSMQYIPYNLSDNGVSLRNFATAPWFPPQHLTNARTV